jgi:hypothetical protein
VILLVNAWCGLISFLVALYVGISTKVLPCEITVITESLDISRGITICFFRTGREGEPSLTRTAFWSETRRTRFPFCKVKDQVYSRKYARSTLFYVSPCRSVASFYSLSFFLWTKLSWELQITGYFSDRYDEYRATAKNTKISILIIKGCYVN